ncbi:HAD hydrolase-like protein [Shewanella benthica]|uniref:HAD family hydrolase n=1 Tax=Shewanella benthica TaxID=43661 RepID=UPI00187A0C29|nr:HAD hydrolase-like protein [Shewanella benthica]MBE7216386.1 HAD family hydrolase [Shewanella benthica]MCL1065112.1 HAD hydrolase-like protein [Shewanella benthica]
MKLLIFDLDFTLVNTNNCQDYLKTRAGREAIVEKLDSGEVTTSLYFPETVDFVNELVASFMRYDTDTLPIIVSDSPRAYCEKLIELHGFNIPSELIFPASHKPCVDICNVLETVNAYTEEKLVKVAKVSDCLVIGDSARDIHFGHEIKRPSVWAKWGNVAHEHVYDVSESKPTRTVNNLDELAAVIDEFIGSGTDGFEYTVPDFKKEWDIQTVDIEDFTEQEVEDIGFCEHYVPEALTLDNQKHKYSFFDVNWVLKPAKNVPENHLWKAKRYPQKFYTQAGTFTEAKSLMRLAGIFKGRFKQWIEEKGITGKVLLVPIPSSVPAECNKTQTVKLIAGWWTEWINKLNPDFTLVHKELLVERFKPKIPTHAQGGQRHIEDQLSTMGLFKGVLGKLPDDITAVVFLDDVTTSGNSINAMATIFRELEVVPKEVPLYGYVWFKTYHPDIEFDIDFDFEALIAKADNVAADN